jgi:hypothetical protein
VSAAYAARLYPDLISMPNIVRRPLLVNIILGKNIFWWNLFFGADTRFQLWP